jgi:hypothetical protein
MQSISHNLAAGMEGGPVRVSEGDSSHSRWTRLHEAGMYLLCEYRATVKSDRGVRLLGYRGFPYALNSASKSFAQNMCGPARIGSRLDPLPLTCS